MEVVKADPILKTVTFNITNPAQLKEYTFQLPYLIIDIFCPVYPEIGNRAVRAKNMYSYELGVKYNMSINCRVDVKRIRQSEKRSFDFNGSWFDLYDADAANTVFIVTYLEFPNL